MNAAELMKSILEYGADMDGISDRFGGNDELYEMCFREFLEEPNFEALSAAMDAGDYERAFDAAHALKGLSGNLGLTAFYEAVCALVEDLRAGRCESAPARYAEVEQKRAELTGILTGEQPALEPLPAAVQKEAAGKAKNKPDSSKMKYDKYVRMSIIIILAAILLVTYLFCRISMNYKENVVSESGEHLIEMSNQIKLYIEEQVANDWRIAQSVGDSIVDSGFGDDDEAIFGMLQRKQQVWGVSDLMLYTENGYCVYANGDTEQNDIASDTVDSARRQGKYMSVIDSRIIYTLPLDTSLRYMGSQIVAVSVVQDMKTFLDDMSFSSFDGEAWMYLTEESGIVISMLTNDAAVSAFNFKAVVEDMTVEPLSAEGEGDLFSAQDPAAFLLTNGKRNDYAVSMPIYTGELPLRLFYLAPEAVVNKTMNGFSRQLTVFSLLIILSFSVLAFLTFMFIYNSRKRLFDREIMMRDRMFELLIKNTRTAFALFTVNQAEPGYISSNTAEVIGDRFWTLDKTDAGYSMRNDSGTDTEVIRRANGVLSEWDGKTVFKSGYIRNDSSAQQSYFEFELYPVEGEDEDFLGIAMDVTAAYEREEVTRNAMEMAKSANEAKSRFLSNMSHDIRTPMNAIMNMTNFALESIDQPKKLGGYLHTIHESSEHLLHLINDVLDMSRIESGQTVVTSAPFNISTEVQRQADIVRPLCAAKDQTLITDFDGLSTAAVCGDALKLSQIIMNLLSNAVKFTPEKGAVRFTAAEIPSLREDIVDVRFTIEDNGIGISEENIDSIFSPFYRADDKRVGKIEGTGLGLSICKSYVEAMGGAIKCESEMGEGSTFTVELFFQRAEADSGAVTEEPLPAGGTLGDTPFLGMRCLVAEDNGINRMIAKTLLERTGFIVELVEDGGTCVERFLGAKPGTYDIVYMDIQMPVMDGCQAASTIRASAHPLARTIPIVAMTANVFAEDIEKARIAGMDAYVGKPIVSFDLIEQTGRAINKKRGQQS